MTRIFLACLFLVFTLLSVSALAKSTSDINHSGFFTTQKGEPNKVRWKAVSTDCVPCKTLVQQYNATMKELLYLRYLLASSQYDQEVAEKRISDDIKKGGEDQDVFKDGSRATKGLGLLLETGEAFNKFREILESMIPEAEIRAQNLRKMIAECEKQCVGKTNKTTGILDGGLPAIESVDNDNLPPIPEFELQFDWRGPYPEVCAKCAELARQLNQMPSLARERYFRLAEMKREKQLKDAKQQLGYAVPTSGYAGLGMPIPPAEGEISEQERLERELQKLELIFLNTLKKYEDCVPKCPKKVGCVIPDSSGDLALLPGTTPIVIGPNDKYGSGAALKGKAKGMAMGALGKMLGGKGGGSIGSPMGGNSTKGPSTVKDPVKDKHKIESEVENASGDEVELALGGTWTKNGNLLISAEIEDADQDGTFQAIFIDDAQGNRHVPIGYYLYELYRDWKLTVWWTHDKWVDGEHVYHDEGEEISTGRDELGGGAIALFDKKKAANNGVWSQLGFGTAQKGAKGVGAEFAITSPMLAAGQAMRVYAHVTQPKNDPVDTIPVTYDVRMENDALIFAAVSALDAQKSPCPPSEQARVVQEEPGDFVTEERVQEISVSPQNTVQEEVRKEEPPTDVQKEPPEKAQEPEEEQNPITKGLNSIFKNNKSGKKINQGAGNE